MTAWYTSIQSGEAQGLLAAFAPNKVCVGFVCSPKSSRCRNTDISWSCYISLFFSTLIITKKQFPAPAKNRCRKPFCVFLWERGYLLKFIYDGTSSNFSKRIIAQSYKELMDLSCGKQWCENYAIYTMLIGICNIIIANITIQCNNFFLKNYIALFLIFPTPIKTTKNKKLIHNAEKTRNRQGLFFIGRFIGFRSC